MSFKRVSSTSWVVKNKNGGNCNDDGKKTSEEMLSPRNENDLRDALAFLRSINPIITPIKDSKKDEIKTTNKENDFCDALAFLESISPIVSPIKSRSPSAPAMASINTIITGKTVLPSKSWNVDDTQQDKIERQRKEMLEKRMRVMEKLKSSSSTSQRASDTNSKLWKICGLKRKKSSSQPPKKKRKVEEERPVKQEQTCCSSVAASGENSTMTRTLPDGSKQRLAPRLPDSEYILKMIKRYKVNCPNTSHEHVLVCGPSRTN